MSWITHNFSWKILSLFVAFGLWFMVMSSNSIEITKEVLLELDVPSGLTVANEVPDRVTFRLSGSKFFLRTVVNSLDAIRVDLSKAKAGPTYYRIDRESLRLPIGVKVLSISPSTINPILEPILRRTVPVVVTTKNQVPTGYRLLSVQAKPASVRIKGPRSAVEKVSSLKLPAIDVSDIPAVLKWEIPMSSGIPGITFDEESEPKVVVEVEPTGSNFRVAGVPVKVESAKHATLNIEKVALYVNCPPKMIQSLTPDKVKAYVQVQEKQPGSYVKDVKVDLPSGVKLVRVVPDKVLVQLE